MSELVKQDWYKYLVEDCQAIITQRVKNSRSELITGYGEFGKRVVEDPNYNKHGKGNRGFNKNLFEHIGVGERTGYYAIQFYEKFIHGKFDDVSNALQSIFPEEGDNLSWYKICNKYLPSPKEEKVAKPIIPIVTVTKRPTVVQVSTDGFERDLEQSIEELIKKAKDHDQGYGVEMKIFIQINDLA